MLYKPVRCELRYTGNALEFLLAFVQADCAILTTGPTALKAIYAMLKAAVDAFCAASAPGGCLLILGATNCAVESKAVQDHLLSIRRQISQSILDRLKRGQHDGDVPKTAPVAALAAYYSTLLHGLALQSRDGASRKTLMQVVELAMEDR